MEKQKQQLTSVLQKWGISTKLSIGILLNLITKMNIILLIPHLRKAEKRWAKP
jgi:hypothetical protein